MSAGGKDDGNVLLAIEAAYELEYDDEVMSLLRQYEGRYNANVQSWCSRDKRGALASQVSRLTRRLIEKYYRVRSDQKLLHILRGSDLSQDLEVLEWCLRDNRPESYSHVVGQSVIVIENHLSNIISQELPLLTAQAIGRADQLLLDEAVADLLVHGAETRFTATALDLLLRAGAHPSSEAVHVTESSHLAILAQHGIFTPERRDQEMMCRGSWLLLRQPSRWPNLTYRVVLQLQALDRTIQQDLSTFLQANMVVYLKVAL